MHDIKMCLFSNFGTAWSIFALIGSKLSLMTCSTNGRRNEKFLAVLESDNISAGIISRAILNQNHSI
jgi:hypothetical protein